MAGCLAGSPGAGPPSLRGVAASSGRVLRGWAGGQVYSPIGKAPALDRKCKGGPREAAACGQGGEQHHDSPVLPVELIQGVEDPVINECPVKAHSARCSNAHAQQQMAARSGSPERSLQAGKGPKQAARKPSAAAAAPAPIRCPRGAPARRSLRWPVKPGRVAPSPLGMAGGHCAFFAQKAGTFES